MTEISSMHKSMNFLIIGCGSIGERHIKNLADMLPRSHIEVFDPQEKRLAYVSAKFHTRSVKIEKLESTRYDCVFICTPPVFHVELAKRALNSDSNVFIEKPLSAALDGAKELLALVRKKKLLAFVGYNFRFNKGIRLIRQMVMNLKFGRVVHTSAYFGQYLPDWRPSQDYRSSYSASKELGGGIIFDGSHEIDYLSWLFGRPTCVQAQFAFTNTISADTEAIADILLTFDSNILGHVHLDFLRREYKRNLEIICENGIVQWSMREARVRIFDASSKSWDIIPLHESVNDMYMQEIKHVIKCLHGKNKSEIIDLQNGISTLSLCHDVYAAGLSGERILL